MFNYDKYIGHYFVKEDNTCVKLNSVYITTETTGVYSIFTYYSINCFAEGILSITPANGWDGLFEYFTIGDNMKYDEKEMENDINTYGLYTYDEWKDYMSFEQFNGINVKYLKVAVGKGLITENDIKEMIYLINLYAPKRE